MAEQKVESAQQGSVQIYRIFGYFDDTIGKNLHETCNKAITAGTLNYVFNLAGSPVINSPGLSMLLDLVVNIIDYNDGKVALAGLNNLTRNALRMTGVLTLCKEYPTEPEAIASLGA